jgi:hypothetical protein
MHQDNVVSVRGQGGQGVGYRFLAVVAAFDDVNAAGKSVLGYLALDALHLRLADGNIDGGHAIDGGEGAEGMNEDGNPIEVEKLFRLRPGHPGA